MNLSLVGRTLIVNQVLMSSLWCFITVWAGSKKIIWKIKALLRNYLWSGSENIATTCVSWDDYMMPKEISGPSLISPKDAMKALMSEWIVQALLPNKSNLQIILRSCIMQLQPSYYGPWGPSPLWLFSPNFSTKGGLKFGITLLNCGRWWQAPGDMTSWIGMLPKLNLLLKRFAMTSRSN